MRHPCYIGAKHEFYWRSIGDVPLINMRLSVLKYWLSLCKDMKIIPKQCDFALGFNDYWDNYADNLYAFGVMPVRDLNRREKCCGYSKPSW